MHTTTICPPTPEQVQLAQRLHRLVWVVRRLVLLGAAWLLLAPLLLLWAPDTWLALWLEEGQRLPLASSPVVAMDGAVRLRLLLASTLPVALGLGLLWQLWQLFGQYRCGLVFSPLALASLRRFGWLLLVLALTAPLTHAALGLALTLDNPPGQRLLVISLSSNDYALALLALVFIALARVIHEASRVAEDNAGFV